jgi:endonuclease/exonuclease/phosphatase family metal-dependent hydrolase
MRSTIAAMCLLAGIFVLNSSAADTLSVLTYNLQGMKPGTDPETRTIHIIENLKVLDPDIIGLQEINESGDGQYNQAQHIADSLGAFFGIEYHVYMAFTHLSWDNQFREYIGIISKLPVEEEGFAQLVPGVFPRKVVWNAVATPVGKVNIFNTHLSFNSASVRMQQVQQIATYIAETENLSSGVASILTGDFNDGPNSPTIRLLTESETDTFFVDTYAHSNPTSLGYTFPATSPSSRIDFIFEKNTGDLSIDTSSVVMTDPYDGTHFCSDHFAVLTLFFRDKTSAPELPIEPVLPGLSLFHPTPNPTSGNTLISYFLPRGGSVSLDIYTLSGQHVRRLTEDVQSNGSKRTIWDGRDSHGRSAASAVYLVRLGVDEAALNRRVSVVR